MKREVSAQSWKEETPLNRGEKSEWVRDRCGHRAFPLVYGSTGALQCSGRFTDECLGVALTPVDMRCPCQLLTGIMVCSSVLLQVWSSWWQVSARWIGSFSESCKRQHHVVVRGGVLEPDGLGARASLWQKFLGVPGQKLHFFVCQSFVWRILAHTSEGSGKSEMN